MHCDVTGRANGKQRYSRHDVSICMENTLILKAKVFDSTTKKEGSTSHKLLCSHRTWHLDVIESSMNFVQKSREKDPRGIRKSTTERLQEKRKESMNSKGEVKVHNPT